MSDERAVREVDAESKRDLGGPSFAFIPAAKAS